GARADPPCAEHGPGRRPAHGARHGAPLLLPTSRPERDGGRHPRAGRGQGPQPEVESCPRGGRGSAAGAGFLPEPLAGARAPPGGARLRRTAGRQRPTPCSAVAALHGALHLALAFALADGVALVVLRLALGERDLALGATVLPVQLERHQGVALLLHLADQAPDLVLVHEQLLGARRLG